MLSELTSRTRGFKMGVSILVGTGVLALPSLANVAGPIPITTPRVAGPDVMTVAAYPRGSGDPSNAALVYYKAWMDPAFEALSTACAEAYRAGDAAWKPDAELTKQLVGQQGLIANLLRGSQAPECDFGIEWSQGIGTLLPHLGKARGTCRILGSDARRCVAEGKLDEAAERVAACYRIARHVAHDGIMISGLVSVAMAANADSQVNALMNGTHLTVAGKELLLAEGRKLTVPDAFGMKKGIEGERRWTCDWLRSFSTGKMAGMLVADQIVPLVAREDDQTLVSMIGKMDEASVNAELGLNVKYYQDVLNVWEAADALDQLIEIEAKMRRGEYGTISMVVSPAVSKGYKSDLQGRTQHAELLARLERHIALSR